MVQITSPSCHRSAPKQGQVRVNYTRGIYNPSAELMLEIIGTTMTNDNGTAGKTGHSRTHTNTGHDWPLKNHVRRDRSIPSTKKVVPLNSPHDATWVIFVYTSQEVGRAFRSEEGDLQKRKNELFLVRNWAPFLCTEVIDRSGCLRHGTDLGLWHAHQAERLMGVSRVEAGLMGIRQPGHRSCETSGLELYTIRLFNPTSPPPQELSGLLLKRPITSEERCRKHAATPGASDREAFTSTHLAQPKQAFKELFKKRFNFERRKTWVNSSGLSFPLGKFTDGCVNGWVGGRIWHASLFAISCPRRQCSSHKSSFPKPNQEKVRIRINSIQPKRKSRTQ